MRLATAVAVIFVLLLAAGAPSPASARANVSVSVSFFYDSLAPYGHWYDSPRYGYVWHPREVYAGWRPYLDGRWVYTDYGWTFASDDPWGWATYHYGRWYFDPALGWVWVPDTEWGPAWVSFYEADDWIGWAPLPPRGSFSLAFARRPAIDPGGYCFVEKRFFLDPQVHRRVAPISRNATLARRAGSVARLPSERIARATGRQVPRMRVVESADVRGAVRGRIRGHEVAMFRPEVRAKATHSPRGARAMPQRESRRPEARQQQQRVPERRALAPQQRAQRSPQVSAAPRRGQQARVERAGPRPPRREIQQQRRGPDRRALAPQQRRPPERRVAAPQQRRPPERRALAPQQRAQRSPQVSAAPRHGPQARIERAGQRPPRRDLRQQQRGPERRMATPQQRRPSRQPEARASGRERSPARQQRRARGPRPPSG